MYSLLLLLLILAVLVTLFCNTCKKEPFGPTGGAELQLAATTLEYPFILNKYRYRYNDPLIKNNLYLHEKKLFCNLK